jgi:TolB protein
MKRSSPSFWIHATALPASLCGQVSRRLTTWIMLLAWFALWLPGAQAQLRIDVSGVGATQLPIAVASFAGTDRSATDIAAIIRSDLSRIGAFRMVDFSQTSSDSAPADYPGLSPARRGQRV